VNVLVNVNVNVPEPSIEPGEPVIARGGLASLVIPVVRTPYPTAFRPMARGRSFSSSSTASRTKVSSFTGDLTS
jgi:hypothetical protein